MKNATSYARLFLCVLIMIVVLIVPATTGFSTARTGSGGQMRNQIDTSSFMPVWNESFLDAPASSEEAKNMLAKSIWDMNLSNSTQMGEIAVTRSMEDILAEDLGQDSGSGYGKLTEMARNGYADLGANVQNGTVIAESEKQPAIQVADKWANYPGAPGNGNSGGNSYTTVPTGDGDDNGSGTDDGGGGDDGGGAIIPDNPVVPAPAALILAGLGASIIRVFRKYIQ